jgi:hypothetical protein
VDPGAELKTCLTEMDLTYEAAGKELRVSRQTIWAWITGESVPGEAAKGEIESFTKGRVPASAWPVVDRRRKPEEPAA